MAQKVLVVVVSYNGRNWLERCLCSVVRDADVLLVDNASGDGGAAFVKEFFPQVQIIENKENTGFSKANNLGFKKAAAEGYDYVYLLNQDAWLLDGALDTLVAAAEEHPEYAVLSPLQLSGNGETLDYQFAKLYLHGMPGQAGHDARETGHDNEANSQAAGDMFRNLCHPRQHPEGQVPPGGLQGDKKYLPEREGPKLAWEGSRSDGAGRDTLLPAVLQVGRVMAAHWLVRVKAVREIGLFDEQLFPLYGQDDDWCQRARSKGWKVGIVPRARAIHDRAKREEPLEKKVYRDYYTGSLLRLVDPAKPLWLGLLYVCLFTLVKMFRYRSLRPLKAFGRICRELPLVRTRRRVAPDLFV